MKKEGGSFDATMVAYDGAVVRERIGIYMLYLIGKKYKSKNIGLCIDDGLVILKIVSEPASEMIEKHLQYLFKQKGLQIIIECNLKVVNYLDVTFNLNDGSYRSHRKPNDETHYIHIQSDHPPSITKQFPQPIKKFLSQLSSSKEIFYETTPYYKQRLTSCGYNEKLTYQQQGEKIEKNKNIMKNRKHNIIWFNPPYSKSLKTDIGKYFFRLLNKHFPSGHKLYKIFNKNALKLCYSCMPNLKAKIDGHKKKILETTPPPKTKLCYCLKKKTKKNSPMRGACLTENILYYSRTSCDDERYKPKLYNLGT